jgi:hypothetical protein
LAILHALGRGASSGPWKKLTAAGHLPTCGLVCKQRGNQDVKKVWVGDIRIMDCVFGGSIPIARSS